MPKIKSAKKFNYFLKISLVLVLVVIINYLVYSYCLRDRENAFAAVTVGNNTVGSINYPNAGLRKIGENQLILRDPMSETSVIDTVNHYEYLAGNNYAILPPTIFGSMPVITKMDLNSATPQRVDAIRLIGYSTNQFNFSVIDEANSIAYFGLGLTANIAIVKVDINPTNFQVINTTIIPGMTVRINSAVFDPANSLIYLGGSNVIYQVDVSGATPVLTATLPLAAANLSAVQAPVLDQTNHYLYASARNTATNQWGVIKVDLNSGPTYFQLVDSFDLLADENYECRTSVIDEALGYAYFMTFQRSIVLGKDKVIKVNIAPGSFSRDSAIELQTDEIWLNDSAIDTISPNHYLYVAARQYPGKVVKVDIQHPNFSEIGNIDPSVSYKHVHTVNIDGSNLYFSTGEPIHYFAKVNLGTFLESSIILMAETGGNTTVAFRDSSNNSGYWGTADSPGKMFRVNLANLYVENVLVLDSGENGIGGFVYDQPNQFVYFSAQNTADFIKVDTNPAHDFVKLDQINLIDAAYSSGVLDPINKLAYFGSVGGGGWIRRLDVDPTHAFAVTGTITEPTTNSLNSAVIDVAHQFAYFLSGDSRLFRVIINPSAFSYSSNIVLNPLMLDQGIAGLIDSNNGYMYYGLNSPEVFGKVDVDPGRSFAKISNISFATGEIGSTALFDEANQRVYYAMTTFPSEIIKIKVDDPATPFMSRLGTLTLAAGDDNLRAGIIDPVNNLIFLGTGTNPGKVLKFTYSQKGYINGFKVTLIDSLPELTYLEFYSHQAGGQIQLAIYNTTKDLLWSSNPINNTVTEGWIKVPISNGTPASLISLAAGDYWFAWQTNSTADVGSYSATATGNGFYKANVFGTFPGTIDAETSTDQAWSIYGVYLPAGSSSSSSSGLPPTPIDVSCEAAASDSIKWQFLDSSTNETGFKLYDQSGVFILDSGPLAINHLEYFQENQLKPNEQYSRYVTSINAAGESAPSEKMSCWTLANQPLKPQVNIVDNTNARLIIDKNDNNPDYTEYAIYEVNSQQYVQADGSFGPDAFWQNYEAWGGEQGILVTGEITQSPEQYLYTLNIGQAYNFSVKARNGIFVETIFSEGSGLTPTQADEPETPGSTPEIPSEEGTPPAGESSAPPTTPAVPTPPVATTGGSTVGTPGQPASGQGTAGGTQPGTISGQPNVNQSPGISQIKPGTQPLAGKSEASWFDNLINYLTSDKFKQFLQNILLPILLLIALLNTLVPILPILLNLLPFLHLLFTEPLMYLFRKKREKWGVVYDSLRKIPVDLAIVRLYKADKTLVQTRVTDKDGRYLMMVKDPGKYYLVVSRLGYKYPSKFLAGQKSDRNFLDLYFGEEIKVNQEKSAVSLNIPLDSEDKKFITEKLAVKYYFISNLRLVVSYTGMILSVLIILLYPALITVLAFIAHLILFLIFRRLVVPPKPKSWGFVYDKKNKQPLNQAVVRIFDIKFNKLLETQVADGKGRYSFLVGQNQYQLLAEKDGYQKKEIKPVDLVKQEQIIALDIPLEKA